MKNWTIKKLLIAGFAAPVAVITILTGLVLFGFAQINREVISITEDNVPGLVLGNRALTEALSFRVLTMKHIISKDPVEMAAINAQCDAAGAAALATLKEYEPSIAEAEERAIFEKIAPAFAVYSKLSNRIRQLHMAGNEAEGVALMKTTGLAAFESYQHAVEALVNYNQSSAAKTTALVNSTMSTSRRSVAGLSALAVGLSIAAGFYITQTVNRTLRVVSDILDDTSTQVTSASTQVSGSSQSLAEGASEQAASLEETSASIEELTSMTRRNAESAQQTKDLSSQTRLAADTCADDMQAMNAAMAEIRTSSTDISKIIKTIDEIAFQTNILALNAAVEAARAGDAGMGFAVVAEEVRNLAQRSAESAKETASKIEVAISKSEHGVQISGKVGESLTLIVEKARKVDALVAEIATASQEQSQGINQVNTTINQMDKVTQQTAGNAEGTAAAAEELSAQALAMQQTVADLRRLTGATACNVSPGSAPTRHGPGAPPLSPSPGIANPTFRSTSRDVLRTA